MLRTGVCRVRTRERTEQLAQRSAAPAPAVEDDMKSASCAGPAAARAAAPESASAGGGGGGGGGGAAVSSRELRALVRLQLGGESTPSSPPASHRQGAPCQWPLSISQTQPPVLTPSARDCP